MRQADRLECWALGRSPKESLRLALRTSQPCWTVTRDGFPLAMFGVAATSLADGRGTIWMLGTESVYREGRALLELGPVLLAAMLVEFRTLGNIVSTGNARAIRMLRRWGFDIGEERYTYRGVEFAPFQIERPAVEVAGGFGVDGLAGLAHRRACGS